LLEYVNGIMQVLSLVSEQKIKERLPPKTPSQMARNNEYHEQSNENLWYSFYSRHS